MTPDTEASLLLTSRLGLRGKVDVLSLSEYNQVVKGLVDCGMRPGDLLEGVPADLGGVSRLRLEQLMARGVALAEARIAWSNRGIWVVSRSDAAYPALLAKKLKAKRPPVLFGAGNTELLAAIGFGMVGSRDASPEVLDWTASLAAERVAMGEVVVSGGAKGVDLAAMMGALDAGGGSVGLVANDLAKLTVSKAFRPHLKSGNLLLLSASDPDQRFLAFRAMQRNKFIYALSAQLVVVASAVGSGGTWAGAEENMEASYCPSVFLRHAPEEPGLAALHRLGIPYWGAPEAAPAASEWDRIRMHLEGVREDGLKNIRKAIDFPGKEGALRELLLQHVASGDLERRRNGKFTLATSVQGKLF